MDYEEDKKSKFNAGVAMAERIDSLQRAINMARFNLLKINPETMTYNYEVAIAANDSLFNESWAKLNMREKENGGKIKNIVKDFVRTHPIFNLSNSHELKLNTDNYLQFQKLIDLYEKTNKEFLNTHGMNSPDMDDDEGL